MAEAVGLVLGIGGLAGLFGATVDAFDQIRAARSFSRDYEVLSTRYDMRRALLLQWGTAVGLAGDSTRQLHPRLSYSTIQSPVERALNCIQMLLGDADDLQLRYGLEPILSQTSDEKNLKSVLLFGTSFSRQRLQIFKSSNSRFRINIKDRQRETSTVNKTQWAIFDGRDFRKLLQDLGDLIDDLYKLVPISLDDQARLIAEDASGMPNDVEHLNIVKEALAEDKACGRDLQEALVELETGAADLHIGAADQSYLSLMPETSTAPTLQSETVALPSLLTKSLTFRSAVLHSPAFASVASSNASWATALSHLASYPDNASKSFQQFSDDSRTYDDRTSYEETLSQRITWRSGNQENSQRAGTSAPGSGPWDTANISSGEEFVFNCPVVSCEKEYKTQVELRYHKRRGHLHDRLRDNADGTFSIVQGETSGPYVETLDIEKEKLYKCGVCQKRFKTPNGLSYHRIHSTPCMFPDSYINGTATATP